MSNSGLMWDAHLDMQQVSKQGGNGSSLSAQGELELGGWNRGSRQKLCLIRSQCQKPHQGKGWQNSPGRCSPVGWSIVP